MFLYNKLYYLELVKINGLNLEFIPDIFRNDKEIVLEAFKNNSLALEYASKKLKNNKELILEVVKLKGCYLHFASKRLKNDREIVLHAVKEDGLSLRFVSNKLKKDKEIILEAFKNDKYDYYNRCVDILEFASEELRNDKEFILEVIKSNDILYFASNELKNDKDFIVDCIINNNKIYNNINLDNLYLLIHNLQHNFNIKLIAFDELFLNNINYISKTKHFYNILSFILTNYLKVFIENYKKFIHYIIDNLEYIQLCQKHNIHIFNIDEVTSYGEYNFDDIKEIYNLKYENKIILWY